MEWIGWIVLVVILLKTIERGGDWFDFLQSNERHELWWRNFEFNAMFVGFGLVLVGFVIWAFWQSTSHPAPPWVTTAVEPAAAVHVQAVRHNKSGQHPALVPHAKTGHKAPVQKTQ